MWVRTSQDRVSLYNLAGFEVIFSERDQKTNHWFVLAMQRDGHGRVELAKTDSEIAAENIIQAIEDGLREGKSVIDLGRG